MARRRRQRPSQSAPQAPASVVRLRMRVPLELGDRRVFHPAGPLRPAFSFRRGDRRIIIKQSSAAAPKRNDTYSDWRVAFAVPRNVGVCVRRKQRKEVLHALKRVGKGSGGGRHRWNYWSGVNC